MNKNQEEQFTLSTAEPSTDNVVAVDIDKIQGNPFQPRREVDEAKIDELAQSIKACGLIQPVVVRRSGNGYQLVVGERRYLACRKLGWSKISASVKTLSDNEMATIALIENLQRENLNYIEEAMGYVSLMKNFNLTQEILAQRLGKSQSTIANKLRLLKLSTVVREKLLEKGLTERHARSLLGLENEKEQLETIMEIAERGLTVSQAEKRVERIKEQKGTKISKRSKPIIKDMRIVLNTIREAVNMIQCSGLYPEVNETVEEDYIEITIRLTKEMVQNGSSKKNG